MESKPVRIRRVGSSSSIIDIVARSTETEALIPTPPINVARTNSRFGDYHGFFDASTVTDTDVRQDSIAISEAQLTATSKPITLSAPNSFVNGSSIHISTNLSINEDPTDDESEMASLLSKSRSDSKAPTMAPSMHRRNSHAKLVFQNFSPRMGVSTVFEDTLPQLVKKDPLRQRPAFSQWATQKAGEVLFMLPAVFLGLILNLLDGISYGLILFPTTLEGFPTDLGPDGLSIFFVSTIISQVVYAYYSQFRCANGSQMIEAIPFLYTMCTTIVAASLPEQVVPTTVFVYALSTVVTGIIFFLLGYFKLGSLVQFFPRHILIGCIGGVGFFLIETGIEVCSRLEWHWTLEFFSDLFQPQHFMLWGTALAVAILLQVLHTRIHHPLFVPLYFLSVPAIFYIIVFAGSFSIEELRSIGWIFEAPKETEFYHFYLYFDFSNINWNVVPSTIPSILFLTFFALLHVPINVPSLAVTIGQEVDVNRELVAHGWSNLLAGLAGTVQNYLVYSNSVLYFRAGGNSRIAGLLLALATTIVFFVGPSMVGYIPSPMVGALIFHLGIDLMKEALWTTFGVVSILEYLTILVIVGCMAGIGFIPGIAIGLLLACVFFVVNYARRNVIRATFTGVSLQSSVRRLRKHQQFLKKVGDQIFVMELQGFLFFGTINQISDKINEILEARWESHAIRFLLLDFNLALGMDYSAAEAFARIERSLNDKEVHLVISGMSSEIRQNLERAGILLPQAAYKALIKSGETPEILLFDTLNESLEWAENALIKASSQEAILASSREPLLASSSAAIQVPRMESRSDEGGYGYGTPRRTQIREASTLIQQENESMAAAGVQSVVLQAFLEVFPNDQRQCEELSRLMDEVSVEKGKTLWKEGDASDEVYIVEHGQLLVVVQFENVVEVVESVLPGTLVGEVGFFTDQPRTTTVVAAENCTLYCLKREKWQQLVQTSPLLMLKFMQVAFNYTAAALQRGRLSRK